MAKYKVGDKVRVIRNGEFKRYYMEDKSHHDSMVTEMLEFCGKVVTIERVGTKYSIKECGYSWVDEMFEGLAEEEHEVEFKVGDRVKNINETWGLLTGGELGTIVVVESVRSGIIIGVEWDNACNGHDCNRNGKDGHCFWTYHTKNVELINKSKPTPTPTPTPITNLNVTVNLYENACWYCRKGGVVDVYLAGAMGICPSCGRVCNNTLPTKPKSDIVIEFKAKEPEKPKENEALTTDELKALPNGTRVFTVWCKDGCGTPTWDEPFTTWRTKEGNSLKWRNGSCYIENNRKYYFAYLEEPERPF